MIRLDSCKIEAPIDSLLNYNASCFITNKPTNHEGIVIGNTATLSKQGKGEIGLNGCCIDYQNDKITLQLSSKILYDDYAKGININTIEQAIGNLSKTGIISLDTEAIINSASLYLTDETHHTFIDDLLNDWPNIVNGLSCACVNTRYTPTPYSTAGNKGIVYSTDHKSKKCRLIMYSKYIDLRMKKNGSFLRMCKNPMKVLNESKNTLRIEGNHTSFKTIRERFMLKPGIPKLYDVLTAKGQPCLYYLNEITQPKKNPQLELILKSEYRGRMFLENEGINTIIRAAEYDEAVIESIIRSKFSYASYKAYWYGRDKSKRSGIRNQIIALRAQDKQHEPGMLNPILQSIIKQLQDDYAAAV
jgi:hypothetical protein